MELSVEEPVPGLFVAQPVRGFRYGAEAFWLAGAAAVSRSRPGQLIDLGTGSGIIPMLLAHQGWSTLGVDRQSAWQPAWARSLACSSHEAMLSVVDVRDLPDAEADVVTSNPPFFPQGTGPVAADPFRRHARTESTATLLDFIHAARRSVHLDGAVFFVVPRDRETEVCRGAGTVGLWVRRVVQVGRRRSLVELGRQAAEMRLEACAEDSVLTKQWYRAARGES